jgi:glycosyltransferase involved in cell wall biosynthesis
MTILVRDEEDIIQQNIEFHLANGVDYIIATDNGSIDGTVDILLEYKRAGVLDLINEPGRDYNQSDWVTRMALKARDEYGADWILNNDADEFWVTPEGSLKTVIDAAEAPILRCARRNMICAYGSLGAGNWEEQLINRVVEPARVPALDDFYKDPLPCPYFYLDLPPKVMSRSEGLLRIVQGNHDAQFVTNVDAARAPVTIFHFPVRSPAQFEKKIVQGGQAYQANKDLPERMGWHWRRWYRLYQDAGLTAALADALPSQERLNADLAAGRVMKDSGFSNSAARRLAPPSFLRGRL